jgi:hypothetical protein
MDRGSTGSPRLLIARIARSRAWPFVLVAACSFALGAAVQRAYPLGQIRDSVLEAIAPPSPGPVWRSSPGLPAEAKGRLLLFVLAGQSNMVGVAPLPRERPPLDDRLYVFRDDGLWWVAEEPIHERALLGPGLAFATALVERDPTLRIGLLPCAQGGTTISEWQRNLSPKSYYAQCLKKVELTRADGIIGGYLFYQGEQDAWSADDAPLWGAQFERLVTDIRQDIGRRDLPVIFVRIAPQAAPYSEIVRGQQSSISLPAVAMVTTDDLEQFADGHLSASASVALGRRLADALWPLMRR